MKDNATEGIRQAIMLSQQLREVISQTHTELNGLSFFVRPLALGLFKSKAGQSIQDWERTVTHLIDQLKKLEGSDEKTGAALCAHYPTLRGLLNKLIDFCQAVSIEMTRFTQDPTVLNNVKQVATQREILLRSLITALDRVLCKENS
jgi:hypothetical protein